MTGFAVWGADVAPPPLWNHLGATDIEVIPTAMILVALGLYLYGARRVGQLDPGRPWSSRRTVAFGGAMAVVFVAVETFIGVYDDSLFFDHMIQHLLLIMVAAPLVAMGAPLELLRRSTTGGLHRYVARALDSKVAEVVGHPITAYVLYGVLIPATHLTSLYNYTLTHPFVHDNEHLAFLVVGYLFWRPVVGIEPSRHPLSPGLRLVYLMLAVPVDTFCGMALVFTGHEIFPAYQTLRRSWGPSLVSDLHVGGAIMWVGGDMLMIVAMIPVVVLWLRSEDERTRRIDAELDAAAAAEGLAVTGDGATRPGPAFRDGGGRGTVRPPETG